MAVSTYVHLVNQLSAVHQGTAAHAADQGTYVYAMLGLQSAPTDTVSQGTTGTTQTRTRRKTTGLTDITHVMPRGITAQCE